MNRSGFLIAALGAALGFYASLLGALYALQRRLLYFPDNSRPDPSLAGVPNVAVEHVATEDGLSLLAWYAPPDNPCSFVVLYQAGLAVLHRRGVAPEQILIWGESLGCGVAVRLASEHRVAALLLEAPYTSITALARWQFRFVPVGLLLKDCFDAISRIPAVRAPILVMAGGRDTLIPSDVSRELFAAAGEPKEFWLAPEAGHNDLGAAGAIEAAVAFVRRHLGPNPPTLPTRQ
jgi:fermentation-respiration switch protein FrsA (DUF1100 family)